MNATLQSTKDLKIDFSIAVHVAVPEEITTEEDLADYLGMHLFSRVTDRNPRVRVEIQIGPGGDGW